MNTEQVSNTVEGYGNCQKTKLGAHIYWPRVYLLSNKKRNVIMLAPSNYLKVHSQENGILSLTLDDQGEQRLNTAAVDNLLCMNFLVTLRFTDL